MNVARSVTNSMDGEKDNEKLKLKEKMLAQKIQAHTHTVTQIQVQYSRNEIRIALVVVILSSTIAWLCRCTRVVIMRSDGRQLYCSPIQVTDSVLTCSQQSRAEWKKKLLMLIRNIRRKKLKPILCIFPHLTYSE